MKYAKKFNSEVMKYSVDSLPLTHNEKLKINSIFEGSGSYDSTLVCVGCFLSNSEDSIFYKMNNYEVKIKKIAFQGKNHLINRFEDMVFEIDNRVVFGVRYYKKEIPETELCCFDVLYNGEKIDFSKPHWGNFYNPRIGCIKDALGLYCQTNMHYDKEYNNIYIYLKGADGGSGYSVIFVFKKDKYIGKVIYVP